MKGLAHRIDQYLPYLHLIPLIQMGSQMHHSICEMATALSLNDFIRYHVGYYTSLLPDQVPQRGSSLDSKIRKVLGDASMQAPHVYAVGSKNLRNAGLRKVVAYQVNMANKRERDAHRQKALLNPETASAWEGIPTDINLAYVKNKARTIEQ